MSATHSLYSVKRLAPGSYDVLLYGIVIASMVRRLDGNGVAKGWEVELLDDLPPVRWPAPFTAQRHIFGSYRAALEWLGISEKVSLGDNNSACKSTRKLPSYKTHISPSDRYRMRLLIEKPRFYARSISINTLVRHKFISPTGRTDNEGRVEWAITDAGRAALAEIEP